MRFHMTRYFPGIDAYVSVSINNAIWDIESALWKAEDDWASMRDDRDHRHELHSNLKFRYDNLVNRVNNELVPLINERLNPSIAELEERERSLVARINEGLIPLIDNELRPRIAQLEEIELKHTNYVNGTLLPLINEKLAPRITELEKSEKDLTSQLQAMRKAMEALEAQNAALHAENTSMRGELVTARYEHDEADTAAQGLYHDVEHLERELHEARQPVVQQPAGV